MADYAGWGAKGKRGNKGRDIVRNQGESEMINSEYRCSRNIDEKIIFLKKET